MDSLAERAVMRSSPYSLRPPSPPIIHVPLQQPSGIENHSITPSYRPVKFFQLSSDEFAIITGNRIQTTIYRAGWPYELRRVAQPVLDFLYLGPTSVIRNNDFLQQEAISMMIIARDVRAPRDYPSARAASERLGISLVYIDVNPDNLVPSFYEMVQQANSHLLVVNGSQGSGEEDVSNCFRRPVGKILVTCDTGNDLSPTLAAAYLMLMYGLSMESGFAFVILQRFCCAFDGKSKQALLTWQGLIEASAAVASHSQHQVAATVPTIYHKGNGNTKRRHEATIYEDKTHLDFCSVGDCERFEDRATFVPFVELDG